MQQNQIERQLYQAHGVARSALGSKAPKPNTVMVKGLLVVPSGCTPELQGCAERAPWGKQGHIGAVLGGSGDLVSLLSNGPQAL